MNPVARQSGTIRPPPPVPGYPRPRQPPHGSVRGWLTRGSAAAVPRPSAGSLTTPRPLMTTSSSQTEASADSAQQLLVLRAGVARVTQDLIDLQVSTPSERQAALTTTASTAASGIGASGTGTRPKTTTLSTQRPRMTTLKGVPSRRLPEQGTRRVDRPPFRLTAVERANLLADLHGRLCDSLGVENTDGPAWVSRGRGRRLIPQLGYQPLASVAFAVYLSHL